MTNIKQQYRQEALKRRQALSSEERLAASSLIRNALLSHLEQLNLTAAPMLIYCAMRDEVDTHQLLATDRPLLFAPVAHDHEVMQWHETNPNTCWKTGKFGVQEPMGGRLWVPDLEHAVLICPLVGFDHAGNRLGLGMGCFDRWLSQFGKHILTTIGLAFSCKEVPSIPVEAHDVPLHTIITEQEIIQCRSC